MERGSALPQGAGRFHSNDPVSLVREIGRVAPGARPDIENLARRCRYQMQYRGMRMFEAKTFISNEEFHRFRSVATRALHR